MIRRQALLGLLSATAALLLVGTTVTESPAAVQDVWSRAGQTLRLGTFEGLIELPDGGLAPGPRQLELGRPSTAILWDLVLDGETVFAAAGEGVGLLELAPGAEPQRAAALEREPEILAAARGGGGELYVATGPAGAVYRLDLEGKSSEELFRPESAYIWDLAVLPDGTLAVATGLPGEVFRVDPRRPGTASVLWSGSEPHVRSLAVGPEGRLVAGTVGSGWLLEVDREGGGYVLFDSGRAETVDVAIERDGTVWAAFVGSPGEPKPPPAPGPRESDKDRPGVANITVRPNGGDEDGEERDETSEDDERGRSRRPAVPRGGGVLVRLGPGEEPASVWTDGRETPMALETHPEGGVLMGTARPARVWWVNGEGRSGLWYTVDGSQAVSSIVRDGSSIALAASNPALVVSFGPDRGPGGTWTSDVLDAKLRARMGVVHATAPASALRRVAVEVRVGNTAEPTEGWTAWRAIEGAAAPPDGPGAAIELPLARYLQLRVALEPPASVERVDVRYRGVNRPPEIAEINVLPPGVALRAIPPSAVTSGQMPVVDAPVPNGSENGGKSGSTRWRSKSAFERGARTIRWSADDPDDDALTFDVEACRETGSPCTEWIRLEGGLERGFLSFDSRILSDGIYRFRVRARDDGSNYPEDVREAQRLTPPVVIDHTPPKIVSATVDRVDGSEVVRVVARDARGRLARAEVSRGAEDWIALAPADGIADDARETFVGPKPGGTGAGLTVRVTDAAGNVTLGRIGS